MFTTNFTELRLSSTFLYPSYGLNNATERPIRSTIVSPGHLPHGQGNAEATLIPETSLRNPRPPRLLRQEDARILKRRFRATTDQGGCSASLWGFLLDTGQVDTNQYCIGTGVAVSFVKGGGISLQIACPRARMDDVEIGRSPLKVLNRCY